MRDIISLQGFERLGLIKSIQSGTTTFATNQANATATINAVDTANAFVVLSGYRTGFTGYAPSIEFVRVDLTNPTTLTFFRGNYTLTATDVVSWRVIEFFPGAIRSIQTTAGTIAANETVIDVAINPVDLNKTLLLFSQTPNDSGSGGASGSSIAAGSLTSMTNVRAQRSITNSSFNIITRAYVVEFN